MCSKPFGLTSNLEEQSEDYILRRLILKEKAVHPSSTRNSWNGV